MSRLHALLDDYLALRRGLGFKLHAERQLLPGFVDFVEQAGAESVTVELALAWAKKPTGVDPFRWQRRLSMVRGFARYLHAFDPATEVPSDGLLAYRRSRPSKHSVYGCGTAGHNRIGVLRDEVWEGSGGVRVVARRRAEARWRSCDARY